jgi:molecular chaperone DnaK
MAERAKRIFGIDLGTTYSSIAYVDEYGKAVIIPNAENERVTPSVVFFDDDSIVIGDVAKESSKLYPNEVVSFVKRSMGEPNFIFLHNSEEYRAEEISAYVLKKLAQDAEQFLGETVTEVVITCPAYFGINEREATRKAGEIAGFNVRHIINEPTAAAIAYGSLDSSEDRIVLVYDLGGGTFDVTMIDIRKDSVEVICTGGDHNLGGKDWDDRLVAHMVELFQNETGTDEDILDDPDTWQDLQLSAEKAKKILSQRPKTPISVTHGGDRVKMLIGREKFEEITEDLLERTIEFTKEMLEEAKNKGYKSFDEIILVGGATRMPQISSRISEDFTVAPKIFDPDEAVAKGAAIYGSKLSLNDELIKRIAKKTNTEVDADDGVVEQAKIIEMTPKPIVDEAVQEVAQVTGYSLPAVEESMKTIKDVTSKSFGVVVKNVGKDEEVYNLIQKNTSVPIDVTKQFFTGGEYQETVLIRIMENDVYDLVVPLNHATEIGTAVLTLPPGLPKESPVQIFFIMNVEGRLQITAIESTESRTVEAAMETRSVVQGEQLEQAKERCQSLVVY